MTNCSIVLVSVLLLQTLQLGRCDSFDFGEGGGDAYEYHRKQQAIDGRQIPFKSIVRQPTIGNSFDTCNLNPALVEEIQSYQDVALRIINEATVGSFKGRTFDRLTSFVDTFGARVSGTPELEESIDYMINVMQDYGLENVHGEEVDVPHYFRGTEKAVLLEPRKKPLALMGVVPSLGTPPKGILADVLVVTSFEDLENKSTQAEGKIVVFNQEWVSYGVSIEYRLRGASAAAQHGALAALIKSITPFSMDTPHTGGFFYDPDWPQIPVACITLEDAEFMYRLQEKGERMKIHLTMLNHKLPQVISRNVIGQITGNELPYELVGVSGHIDSWDFGQGAMDDGAGMIVSVEALGLLKKLNLTPRRTLQAILWTSEEVGLVGVQAYVDRHLDDLKNFSAIFESDSGTFLPVGLEFAGSEEAGCIVQEVLKLLWPINATKYSRYPSVGSDISKLIRQGVPGISLDTQNDRYFWFHHTAADTMAVQNSEEMDLCLAVWTVASYIISDLSIPLPRRF